MIGQLRGLSVEVVGNVLLLEVGGVGYEATCSRALLERLEPLGSEVTFPVFTNVREDELKLFGFTDRGERQLFVLLTKVNGLGPRSALDIISQVERRVLLRAIGSGDVVALTSVKGIGRKKAERIVVELKDIVLQVAAELTAYSKNSENGGASLAAANQDATLTEALQALQVLGFSRRDAERALNEAALKVDVKDSGSLIREALRCI